MLQETRLHRIRALLTTQHQLSTERIINELGISRETARRDIIELEAQGLARRVHGGLVAVDSQPEPPLQVRRNAQAKEKRAIAVAAAQHLQRGVELTGKDEGIERHVRFDAGLVAKLHHCAEFVVPEIVRAQPRIESRQPEIHRVGAIRDRRAQKFLEIGRKL